MKNIKMIMLLMAALTLGWGCSSDDDEEINPGEGDSSVVEDTTKITFQSAEKPDWQVDWSWHDEVPNWQNPISTKYENRMYFTITLHPWFDSYASEDDMMAIFIGDECRGMSTPNFLGEIYFPIMVSSNEAKYDTLSIRYYCASMKQIFEYENDTTFVPDGIKKTMFYFPADCSKYKMCAGLVKLEGNVPFTPSENDMLGVFVGDECRGVGRIGEVCHVCGRQGTEKETFQLRYYSEEKGGIYTVQTPIEKSTNWSNINLTITF